MKFQINTHKILFTQLGDEGIIFDIENNDYITFNETMLKILLLADQGNTSNAIATILATEYLIDELDCREEVSKALKEMEAKNFIKQIN